MYCMQCMTFCWRVGGVLLVLDKGARVDMYGTGSVQLLRWHFDNWHLCDPVQTACVILQWHHTDPESTSTTDMEKTLHSVCVFSPGVLSLLWKKYFFKTHQDVATVPVSKCSTSCISYLFTLAQCCFLLGRAAYTACLSVCRKQLPMVSCVGQDESTDTQPESLCRAESQNNEIKAAQTCIIGQH